MTPGSAFRLATDSVRGLGFLPKMNIRKSHELANSENSIVAMQVKRSYMSASVFMPRHENGQGIKCYPCPSVYTLRTYVCPDDIRSLNQLLLIRILGNLVTLFSTIMSSSSLIMVHIAPGFQ